MNHHPLTVELNLNDRAAKNPSANGQRVSSLELLQTVNAGFVVEASLRLTGGLRSTHFLSRSATAGLYCHEGCDGEQSPISEAQFLDRYPETLGRVWCLDVLIAEHCCY